MTTRYLQQFPGGHLLLYTEALARRKDMHPYFGPVPPKQATPAPATEPEPKPDPHPATEGTPGGEAGESGNGTADDTNQPGGGEESVMDAITKALGAFTDKVALETWAREQHGIELDRRRSLDNMKADFLATLEG